MLATIKSYALSGIEGYPVDIEVDTQAGIASFDIVGLPDTGIRESRNRVRAAIKNSSFQFVPKRVTVNLAPADTRKEGSLYDFPIAIGFLASTEQLPQTALADYVMLGELSLDGSLRRVNGILPVLISAYQNGFQRFIIPAENAEEARYIDGIEVYPAKNLSEACAFLGKVFDIAPLQRKNYETVAARSRYGVDMADVKGQTAAKRALEIAVAGGHNIMMCGVPGAGKTMLAKAVPTIMPDMTFAEAIETTKIHSVAGLLNPADGIVAERPFRTPHHTASLMSLTGGGMRSTPGEVSLAHNGVLFLDEMPEYAKKTLETLRQPLEDGVITVARVARTVEYPARFMLIASMNPCPCGNDGSKQKECTCTPTEKRKYRARLSGPLLDRIDIHVEVDGVGYEELRTAAVPESSAAIKVRVEKAREIQRNRYAGTGFYTNAQMRNEHINRYCTLDAACESLIALVYKRYQLSARGATRILKTARTVADLNGNENITAADLAEAVQYRVRNGNE